MFSGFGKADRKRPTSEPYEREAALLLERRIAEGRPPPGVWRKAEEGRARRAQPVGWYVPAAPRRAAPISQPFVLRLVRLPLAAPNAASGTETT